MLPEPLTPATLDLRDFDWMPLDVARLRDSDLSVLASGDAFRAAVLLWCAAWHQVPAASLPMEDRLLANLAGYGRDLKGWTAARSDALRGFIECSDGRLYHPVVAEKAIEADAQRNKQRKRTAAATSARRNVERNDDRDVDRDVDRDGSSDGHRNEVHLTLPNPTIPLRGRESAPAKVPSQGLGNQIDPAFQPSPEALARCREQGAADPDIDGEVRKFVAHHQVKQTFSPNWDASWAKWWENWKPHKEKHAPRQKASTRPKNTAVDWDSILTTFKSVGHWSRDAGPDLDSPACRCPPEMLEKYGLEIRRMDA